MAAGQVSTSACFAGTDLVQVDIHATNEDGRLASQILAFESALKKRALRAILAIRAARDVLAQRLHIPVEANPDPAEQIRREADEPSVSMLVGGPGLARARAPQPLGTAARPFRLGVLEGAAVS